MVCKEYILFLILIIDVLYSFTHIFSNFYIGSSPILWHGWIFYLANWQLTAETQNISQDRRSTTYHRQRPNCYSGATLRQSDDQAAGRIATLVSSLTTCMCEQGLWPGQRTRLALTPERLRITVIWLCSRLPSSLPVSFSRVRLLIRNNSSACRPCRSTCVLCEQFV